MTVYVVATAKPWNIAAFNKHASSLPGEWLLIDRPGKLVPEEIERLNPRYIFFPHWSWLVPQSILDLAECVCFHASDVPYGRGGSPIQNLIARGHHQTVLSAIRMVKQLDAGPVYLKRPLSLVGRGQDIFESMAELTWEMISEILCKEPEPDPQLGEVVVFPRRTPEQSKLPSQGTLGAAYDHIRMLDAETYPPACIDYGDYHLSFSHAELGSDALTARVTITLRHKPSSAEVTDEQ